MYMLCKCKKKNFKYTNYSTKLKNNNKNISWPKTAYHLPLAKIQNCFLETNLFQICRLFSQIQTNSSAKSTRLYEGESHSLKRLPTAQSPLKRYEAVLHILRQIFVRPDRNTTIRLYLRRFIFH